MMSGWRLLRRGHAPVLAGLLLVAMAWGMAACAIMPFQLNERVVVPSCMSQPTVATPLPNEQHGFGGSTMTDQVPVALGFSPLLATSLPANLTWNGMLVAGPPPSGVSLPHGIVAPLFHATYRPVTPPTAYGPHTVAALALDETTAPGYTVTSLLIGAAAFRVEGQSATQVGAAPAVLYHLAPPAQDHAPGVTILALVWRVGDVTLQLTAVQGGAYRLQFSRQASVPVAPYSPGGSPPPDPGMTTITSWAGASDATLLAIARSVTLYTGCAAAQ